MNPPSPAWRRRLPAILLALLALMVLGHTLLWRNGAQRLERDFAATTAARRALGWTITHAPPMRGGWPLSVRLTIPDLALDNGDADPRQRLAWRGERLILRLAFAWPRSLLVQAEGRQSLRIGEAAEIRFTADSLRLESPLAPPAAVVLRIENLRAGLPMGGLTVAWLTLRGELHPAAAQGEPAVALSLDAQGITLPPTDAPWPLGPRIARVMLDGAATGPWPRLGPLGGRAAQWRDRGGALTLRRIGLVWGPLDLIGSATLALDDEAQPMGAANLRSFGHDETLAALTAAGLLPAATAEVARLGLLRRGGEDSPRPLAEAMMTLQRRELAVGRIRLGRIPASPWPGPP